jgi:MFS family permease
VADHLPAARRAVGLGFLGAAAEGGGLFGPLWGGSWVQIIGWRGHFWINVPLCIPVIVIVLMFMRRSGEKKAERAPVDYLGGLLLGGALTCLAVALTDDPVNGRPLAINLALYFGAVLFGGSFFLRERLAKVPMIMLSLFRSRPFTAGNLTHLLVGGTLIVAMVDIPVFTIVVKNGSYFDGGLNLMRLTVMLPLGAIFGGFLAGWLGFHRTIALGMIISAVGFGLMTFWTQDVHDPQFTLNLLLTGLGFGLVIAPISASVINAVADHQRATASALLVVMRLVGMLVGVALLTSRGLGAFYQRAGSVPIGSPEYAQLVKDLEVSTFTDTFRAAAVVCVLAVIPAMLVGRGVVRRFRWTEIWRAPH